MDLTNRTVNIVELDQFQQLKCVPRKKMKVCTYSSWFWFLGKLIKFQKKKVIYC